MLIFILFGAIISIIILAIFNKNAGFAVLGIILTTIIAILSGGYFGNKSIESRTVLEYRVVFNDASGQVNIFTTRDKVLADNLVSAIGKAIALS